MKYLKLFAVFLSALIVFSLGSAVTVMHLDDAESYYKRTSETLSNIQKEHRRITINCDYSSGMRNVNGRQIDRELLKKARAEWVACMEAGRNRQAIEFHKEIVRRTNTLEYKIGNWWANL